MIKKRKDMAFYIKMFPLVRIHPEAYRKAKAIVCEKNNKKALKLLEDAFEKKPLPEPSCEAKAVDETLQLANSLGIRGAPTIIFQDGSRINGTVSAEKLIKLMESK